MTLGTDRAKIAVEENGVRKFLKDIEVEDTISYELTNKSGAELLTLDQLMVYTKKLQANEPNKKFIIIA